MFVEMWDNFLRNQPTNITAYRVAFQLNMTIPAFPSGLPDGSNLSLTVSGSSQTFSPIPFLTYHSAFFISHVHKTFRKLRYFVNFQIIQIKTKCKVNFYFLLFLLIAAALITSWSSAFHGEGKGHKMSFDISTTWI